MRPLRLLLVFVLLGAVGGAGLAQPARPGAARAAKREQIKQRILAMRAWALTRELGLDERTASRLFPVIARYDGRFARLLRERLDLRRAAEAAAAAGDDHALDRVIDKIVANQRALWDTEAARFQDVRKVLTPRQAAHILVVLPKIDRRIQNQLRRALDRRRGRASPARRGGAQPDPDDDDLAPPGDVAPDPY
jgi:hypothetical protein